jgi:glycosyltransferase involved in cell wall biosynthesis
VIDRLHVVGPVRGASGYDRHTRELVRQFVRLGVHVQLTHLAGWSLELPDGQRPTWPDELERPVDADTVLHFTMPPHARPDPARRNVNYTMFEASGIPREWAALARAHERIVVPTEACRAAWLAGGVCAERVRVTPLAVDARQFASARAPLALTTPAGEPVAARSVRFLTVAEPRPRKNLIALLRVWIEATRSDDDAVLILKMPLAHAAALERFALDVRELQDSLDRSLSAAAPVVLIAGMLSEEQMPSLYRSATHYLSLSHGEGWDLPMMEAAVAGLELIAPRHTAYVEYLREEEVTFLPARPAPFSCEGRTGAEDELLFHGLSWWDPDERAAAAAIREIVGGRASAKRSPATRIAREYTWERAARELLAAIER